VLLERNSHRDRRSDARLAVNGDPASVALDDRAADGEAQTGALDGSLHGVRRPKRSAEQLRFAHVASAQVGNDRLPVGATASAPEP
jgi:hypothetical protein